MNEKYSNLFRKEIEYSDNFILEKANEMINYWENNEILTNTTKVKVENIQNEIISFSKNMQDYYIDMAKLNTSENFIEFYVTNDELFFDEVSEQIEKRLIRSKHEKLNKNDLVNKRFNESALLKKQMNEIDKYEKYLEGLTLNDYFSENKEMLIELRRIIRECKTRRENLLSKGKPLINYDFPRMI